MKLKPIGVIRSPFKTPAGTPIQPTFAAGAEGTVEVFDKYAPGLRDLDGFDRIWLLYWFDRVSQVNLRVTPFLDTVERGLFATRAPCRPNPVGMSCVRLLRVEGNVLHVADLDVLDGTPLIDVKPYSPRFDQYPVERSGWLDKVEDVPGIADHRFAKDEPAKNDDRPGDVRWV
jgi:tRNA-Thr(GGU) m(6)t(6)A37 methyltransferase TsaA